VKKLVVLTLLASLATATAAQAAETAGNWQSMVARMIAKSQTYPRSAQIRGEEGTTRLKINLAADGKIAGVELLASSGSSILDREAQSIISNMGKLPPPPSGVHALTVPIVWRLN
jgi:periplasmic protein TonB